MDEFLGPKDLMKEGVESELEVEEGGLEGWWWKVEEGVVV